MISKKIFWSLISISSSVLDFHTAKGRRKHDEWEDEFLREGDGCHQGDQPDRVPVIPRLEWCIRQAGFRFSEILESTEKYVFSQYYCVREFQYDAVWDLFAVHAESEALGSKLKIADDMPPSVIEPIVQDYSIDLPRIRIPNPYKDGRLHKMLAIIRKLKELCEGRIPVLGYCQAPFRHAAMLRGLEKILRDTKKAPEKLKELLEISLVGGRHWGLAVAEAGRILFAFRPDCLKRRNVQGHLVEFDSLSEKARPCAQEDRKTSATARLWRHNRQIDTFVQAGSISFVWTQRLISDWQRKRLGMRYASWATSVPLQRFCSAHLEMWRKIRKVIQQAGLRGRLISRPDACYLQTLRQTMSVQWFMLSERTASIP
jgi:hypothetical protein